MNISRVLNAHSRGLNYATRYYAGKNRQFLAMQEPPSWISIECVDSVLENCHILLPIVAPPHSVFVLVISTPLKLTLHLARSSFSHWHPKLHQLAPAALQPPGAQQGLTYMCHSGLLTADEQQALPR